MFLTYFLILFVCINQTYAGYGSSSKEAQSDVEAPAYVPSYLKNSHYGTKSTGTGYTGTKTRYTGTKTRYTGTKTGYAGTKTRYTGTKTGYTGTKTWNSESGKPNYESFMHNANQPYDPICEPDCKNNGICVEAGVCHCPPNFYGHRCQFEKKPCLTFPPLPMNSKRKCSSEMCTISCAEGHQFVDGTTVTNMKCVEGVWQPTRADFTSIPDCNPTCTPPCINGGACLSLNTCQCPEDYRGPQCQYAASVCDIRKLGFNGAYNCFGDGEKFSCKLSCPSGSTYSMPPAELYTCLYSTGTFQPSPIPSCQFPSEVILITPSSHHSDYNISNTYYETHYESSHGSKHNDMNYGSYGHSSYGHSAPNHESFGHTGPAYEIVGSTGHKYETYDRTETSELYGHRIPSGSQIVVIQDLTPKSGSCLTWGGTHYKTFDGQIYSFQSPCQHILVREAKDHKFTVAVRHGECKRKYYCPSELTIFLEDKQYILSVGEEGGVVFRSSKRLLPIPASLPGIRVSMPRDLVHVSLDNGLEIKWDTNNLITVEASVVLWNNTEGLCGTLDSDPKTDLMTKERTIARTKTALASSWQQNKIGDICDSSPTEKSSCTSKSEDITKKALHFCSNIFSKEKFRKCSKVLDVSLLLQACQWDYCSCVSNQSPEDCACSTVSVYAQECLRDGVDGIKTWRDPDTCPMKCPEGKIYKACGPEVQSSCASPLISATLGNSSCVEGCFCPDGLLLEEGRCVPKDQCPCRLRTKAFPPGAVVPKDCNSCACEAGEWKCTQVPCGARCGAVGDPHYVTFDGLRYDFMGHCTYTLLQTDNVTVEAENVPCSGAISEAMNLAPQTSSGKPSCTKAVTIKYGGTDIHMMQGGFILANGKEISELPVHIGKVLIRAASSMFVIVQLPNGVDLWWDGNTRVFVDVPPNFHDKTKGLCGTFNLNQKDDFLTPEGDVEQTALAFANKWKTREFCEDMMMTEPEHPCKANVENKAAAEKYCSKLKSKLFESCRWYVDVEPYYEACLYDMCACAGDVARCLCPVLGDYAMACAAADVRVQWRYNVKECEVSCTGGQEYTVCADSCQRSCTDVSLSEEGAGASRGHCKPRCVEGCACAAGSLLDHRDQCVPRALCSCYHKGLRFEPGYKEVRPGRRERELCTCTGGIWECKPATEYDIKQYPPADDLRLNCSAANHQEFTTCMTAEPLTCKNMHLPPSPTTAECRAGCACAKGFVLETGSARCVAPTACPCHHGGASYADGHVMQEDCNTCECKKGNWTCTQKKCSGVCGTWGDSHFTTFDGKDYDFEGVCTYLMAKGVMEVGKDGFVVEIQNVPCGTTGATCSKSITLKVGNAGNEETVSLTKEAPLPDVSKLKRIKLRLAGAFVFLDVLSLGMSVQWDRGTRVYVTVDPMWANRVRGLCGNYNMDARDDFQTPSGGGIAETSALIFADSWKLKPTCPKTAPVRDHCEQRPERKGWASSVCGALKRLPFSLCHSEVPASEHWARCEKDACACDAGDDCACACAALAAYAHACAARGVVFKWRTPDLCPMQCDQECSTYDACISPCPPETCDNTLNYEEVKNSCQKDACVEGCKLKEKCEEGFVYTNNSYKECVPRAKCRPTCMTLEDGRVVLEGEVMVEDACHTCRCSKNERICTGQPCSTEAPIISTAAPTVRVPNNEPLKCVTGWTNWVNKHKPESINGESIDKEPLPSFKDLAIGTPMCKKDMITKVECRTVNTHQTPKDTGLDVECSLERGLVCKERGSKKCPDFEIRVYCHCEEEPFQCLNSTRPSHPHPTDCHQFYECTPDPATPDEPHAVLKTCGHDMMYNPVAMVCDWPASVKALRPECGDDEVTRILPTVPVSTVTSATVTLPTTTQPSTTTLKCPAGQVYSECAYPCDKLCDYFKKTLIDKGKCLYGQKCIEGCIDESIAKIKCDFGALWRDERTCVPVKDCTCYGEKGNMIKPNGVDVEGCLKCQCLDNKFHCDNSECVVMVSVPGTATPRQPLMSTEALVTPKPTPVIITKTTISPPPMCNEDRFINLLWDTKNPDSKITASSVASPLFEPQFARIDGRPSDKSAGSWNPSAMDEHQFIQAELPIREPVYGVKLQGSPLFDQYVTSYEVMYGDDGFVFHTVDGADDKPKVFRGPVDHQTVSKQIFDTPIEGKYIRIRPLTWHDEIAVRFELIGCESITTTEAPSTVTTVRSTTPELPQCTEPMGLENNLPVDNIEVSSKPEDRKYLSIKSNKGWKPLYSTPGEWILWDLTGDRNITGLKTLGGPDGWVTAYHVMFSSDLNTFNPILEPDGTTKLFPGNFDSKSLVSNYFKPPLRARYLKLLPVKWHNKAEIRAEPIGCFEPHECIEPLGLRGGLSDDQIEVSSNPEQVRYLNLDSDQGWRAEYSAPGEWIMWDLTGERNITGIKTRGSADGWVTGFNIMYSNDLNTFQAITEPDGRRKLFNSSNSATTNSFKPPVRAQYLKLLPVTWNKHIEIRAEPLGCFEPYDCKDHLGQLAGLPDHEIEVSSNTDQVRFLNLNAEHGWRAEFNAPGEWIMWDFTEERNITGLKIKGGPKGWVTGYHVMYSNDLNTFHAVSDQDGSRRLFPGNSDGSSEASVAFEPQIRARYFKLLPVTWHDNIEIRAEPIGCFERFLLPGSTPTVASSPTTAACALCPGVEAPSVCACAAGLYYDGEACSERAQCPCVLGHMTYAVGSTFRGSKCDECVCKLGGITDCKPAKECKCLPELIPKLSAECDCTCSECPANTRSCPTSHICLPLEKWCDGLQDCPDDELDCTTTTIKTTTEVISVVTVPTVGAVIPTPAPLKECPKVDCPPGYFVRYTKNTTPSRNYGSSGLSDLPPPRPRKSYQRYYKGGPTKSTYTKTGFSKTPYGAKGIPKFVPLSLPPKSNEAFSLAKPSIDKLPQSQGQECVQFKCVPKLPPLRPGSTPAPVICSTPKCPPHYTLKLDVTAKKTKNECPQYNCVPPPERPMYCNVTGRTFNTFDGTEYKYDVCFHILARDNRLDAWTVLVRKKCRVDGCVNELLVRQDDDLILVKPNLMIEYDNYEYTYEQTSMICFQKNSFDLNKLGNGLSIASRRYNFTVFYGSNGDVKIGVLKTLMGSVDGLCGSFDGDRNNDRQLPDGRLALSVDEFGRSWARPGLPPDACRTKVVPPARQLRVWELCDVVTKEPLSRCEKILNLGKWRSICLEKICECHDLIVNGTKKTEEQCRCELLEQFVAECMSADKDVDLPNWRIDLNCPAECPAPLVHHDCYRAGCEPSCRAAGSGRAACGAGDGCFPGCYCPAGKLRRGDDCVAPADCTDCVCDGLGAPAQHVTFERDDLPFAGNCTYLAARDRDQRFQIYVTNGQCEDKHALVCTKIIHLLYDQNILAIKKDKKTKQLLATINGEAVYKYPMKNEWLNMVQVAGHDITILVPKAHLELTVLHDKMQYTVKLPSYVYANKTEGLCGICAGYQEHLTTQNGTATDDIDLYGNSWQASPQVLSELDLPEQEECGEQEVKCVIPPPEKDLCYNIFNKDKFGACHALIDPQTHVSSCQEQVCRDNTTSLCAVLERYAAECRRFGVCLHWRDLDSCPYPCEAPLVYRPCVNCQPTCDNYEQLKKEPSSCDKPAAEGCYCPEGKVRVNNTCIEPTKCFPCDAEKQHYVGDEWQEDACTTCSCSKLDAERAAHVSCTTRSCTAPVCDADHDLVRRPSDGCCADFYCVPKPQDNPACEEPKKIDCGFGQVLKQKTTANGCKEFTCECKPADECDPLPNPNDVSVDEPGMERLVDESGCCPVAKLVCKKDTCPQPEACPEFHKQVNVTLPGLCCPQFRCELPKDKCVVTLEWEGSPKGGEKPRAKPDTVLKDMDASWQDGPCRSCQCVRSAGSEAGTPQCSSTQCPRVRSDENVVVAAVPTPFACCPAPRHVACRHGDSVYKIGANWTSLTDVCVMYQCVEVNDGKLEKVTTVKTCDTDCQPGWKYIPAADDSGECCGKCKNVYCIVDNVQHKVGDTWTSKDHCTNYTCVDVHGVLQVQSSNETCPKIEEELRENFVIKEEKIPGKCCLKQEIVACRVDNRTYSEGESWLSDDACTSTTCVRDASGRLAPTASVQTCASCGVAQKPEAPPPGKCCPQCREYACLVAGQIRLPDTTWYSEDNCTQYSCMSNNGSMMVVTTPPPCPSVATCPPEDLYSDGCCKQCKMRPPLSHKTCNPEPLSNDASVGIVRVKLGHHGVCVNKYPLKEFKECRGTCISGTLYNNQTGSHDSKCECCQATRYAPLLVTLQCADGSSQQHRVATPANCACQRCGSEPSSYGTKNPPSKGKYNEYEFPEIDARIKERK